MGIRRARSGRKSRDTAEIASERIDVLFTLADKMARKGSLADSDRYVHLARALGMRYKIRLNAAYRRLFCRKCGAYLVPGRNLRVRLRPGKTVSTCLKCSAVKRRRTVAARPQM